MFVYAWCKVRSFNYVLNAIFLRLLDYIRFINSWEYMHEKNDNDILHYITSVIIDSLC